MTVEYLAVVGDDHHENTVRRERHQRYLLDGCTQKRRGQDDRQAIGQTREGRGGLLHEVVHLRSRVAQLVECGSFGLVAVLLFEKIVDESAITSIGRNAPRRGVRRRQIALVLEHRQLVAHRGRRHAQTIAVDECARADGLRIGDVFLDERLKHSLPAIRQHESRPPSHREVCRSLHESDMKVILAALKHEC